MDRIISNVETSTRKSNLRKIRILNYFLELKMTKLMQKNFHHILQLSQEEQNILASYLQEHLNEFLKKPEKEKRIAEENYTINDFNEETQQAIRNIEK